MTALNTGTHEIRRQRRLAVKQRALATSSTAAIIAGSLLAAGSAYGQSAQTAQTPVVAEEIVVTGSRIVRDGYQAPTPLTVLGEEQLQAAAPRDLADFVNTLPSVMGSVTPRSSTGTISSGSGGINALNRHGAHARSSRWPALGARDSAKPG